MSEGIKKVDRIMAPIAFLGLEATNYNRIYEAVSALPEATATRMVDAIRSELQRHRAPKETPDG